MVIIIPKSNTHYQIEGTGDSFIFKNVSKLLIPKSEIDELLKKYEEGFEQTKDLFKIAETPDEYEQAYNNLRESSLTIPVALFQKEVDNNHLNQEL
ncbi:hypothetical protein [Ferruginibacter albus]|uniref:hypothetical protein n=1 Tax=Ferruginibacter albus TaxID=2875540 RepID=UPI001CC5E39F|nr:hypothetical protein [Ferruginibacter albus]UAY52110.1 hypothetical protein K9M53_00095 [Ferruginibacter albus]